MTENFWTGSLNSITPPTIGFWQNPDCWQGSMQGNWSLEFLPIGSSMQPSVTRHQMAPGLIPPIGEHGMRALKWRLHKQKLLTTSSSGCKKRIGTKKK